MVKDIEHTCYVYIRFGTISGAEILQNASYYDEEKTYKDLLHISSKNQTTRYKTNILISDWQFSFSFSIAREKPVSYIRILREIWHFRRKRTRQGQLGDPVRQIMEYLLASAT